MRDLPTSTMPIVTMIDLSQFFVRLSQRILPSVLSAAQMLTLFRNLPIMIGPKIPEGNENWSCFLLLRKILDIIMCPVLPSSTCATLKILIITEHHTLYCSLCGNDQVIPIMHFLTHYPEQIMAIGPIMRAWTMRHEAKLNFFKQAPRISNFKNIPQSVARRHQR